MATAGGEGQVRGSEDVRLPRVQDLCSARRPVHDWPLHQLRADHRVVHCTVTQPLDQPRGGAAVPARRLKCACAKEGQQCHHHVTTAVPRDSCRS